MDLLEQCFFSLVTFQCGLFFFMYFLRYPQIYGQEYALLLLWFNFHFFDYIFCSFCFNPIPLLLTFLLFSSLLFPSRLKNPKSTNEELFVYTVISICYFTFFFPVRQGRQCAVLDIGTVHLRYTETIWLHLPSFLGCIFFLLAMSQDRNLARFCHISEALCS